MFRVVFVVGDFPYSYDQWYSISYSKSLFYRRKKTTSQSYDWGRSFVFMAQYLKNTTLRKRQNFIISYNEMVKQTNIKKI